MTTYKPMRIIQPPTKPVPLTITRQRSEKSDLEAHGAGLVMSRKHGEQMLLCTPTGDVIVITAIKGADGQMKIGIRCPTTFDAKRRETAPSSWLEEVERAAAAR